MDKNFNIIFTLNIYKFYKYLLASQNVDINVLINTFYNKQIQNLNEKELQFFFDMYLIIYIFLNYFDLFTKVTFCINKIIKEKKYETHFLKLKKIFQHHLNILDINIESNQLISEFLALAFIQSFNKDFLTFDTQNENNDEHDDLIYENDSLLTPNFDNKLFYKTHCILNNFSNFLNEFYVFFDLNESTRFNESSKILKKKNEELGFIIISFCEFEKLIIKKQIKLPKKKINLYGFNNIKNFYLLNLNLKISFFKTSVKIYNNNYYIIGLFHTNVTKVFKENIKSDRFFFLNDYNILEKIRDVEYYLDKQIFKKIALEIKNQYNYNGSNKEFFNFILDKYTKSTEFFYIKNQQKMGSQYYFILIYFSLENYNLLFEKPFYLNCCFDFRGRVYTDSSISPVGNKIFRYLYNYGIYNKTELLDLSVDKNSNYTLYILEKSNISLHYPNLNFKLSYIQKIIEIVFFELGKINKSKYLDLFKGVFSKKNFIDFGIELFLDFKKKINFDFEKKLEIMYILNILDHYNNNNLVKSIIYKDATASAVQLLMVLLDSNNKDNLKICNLIDSQYWSDTYFYIIEFYKNEYSSKINPISLKYFNRKNLKKTIMIYNYGAAFITCWLDFCNNSKISKNQDDFKNIEYNIILEDFKNFYLFLNKFFNGDIFYKNSISDLKIKYKEDLIKNKDLNLVMADKSQTSFIYLKEKIIRLDKIIYNKRKTLLFRCLINEINEEKTFSSFLPNLIHSLDATFVRLVIFNLNFGIITIHDCFGIDLKNVDQLLKSAIFAINYIYNNINNNNEYKYTSLFILL